MPQFTFPTSEPGFAEVWNITLEANRPYVLEAYGRNLVCISAGANFKASFNNGKYFDMLQGARWSLDASERYNTLRLLSPIAQTVTLLTGNIDYDPPRTITTAPTRAVPGPSTIAGGSNIDLTTTPAGMSYRKAVVVTNNDPGSDLDIYTQDSSGSWQLAGTVFHLQAWYLETSDAVRIHNPTGSTIALRVVELFYLSQ